MGRKTVAEKNPIDDLPKLPPGFGEEDEGNTGADAEDEDWDSDDEDDEEDGYGTPPAPTFRTPVGARAAPYGDSLAYMPQGYMPQPVGRPVTPPLWKRASRNPQTVQLRVQRLDNGRPQELGFIAAQANVEDLLRKWPSEGTYWLTPVDMKGNDVEPEPIVVDVPRDHEALQRVKAGVSAESMGLPGGFVNQIPPELWNIVQAQLEAANHRASSAEQLAAEERKALSEERDRISRERLHLSTQNTASAMEVHERLVEKDSERNRFAMEQLMATVAAQRQADEARYQAQLQQQQQFFQAMMAQQNGLVEQERLRLEAEEKRRAAEMEERRRMQELEAKRIREEAKEAEARREREAKQELDRQREHQKMMMALMQSRAEIATAAANPLATLASTAQQIGELKDVLPGVFGAEQKDKGLGEMAFEGLKEVMKTQRELARSQAGLPPEMDDDDERGSVVMQQQQPPQIPTWPQGPVVDAGEWQPGPQVAPQTEGNVFGSKIVETEPQVQAVQGGLNPEVEALDLDTKRNARRAIRKLVGDLRHMGREKWESHVTNHIVAVPDIIDYTEAMGVYNAIVEGGAQEPLATEITDAVFRIDIVPDDFPRVK